MGHLSVRVSLKQHACTSLVINFLTEEGEIHAPQWQSTTSRCSSACTFVGTWEAHGTLTTLQSPQMLQIQTVPFPCPVRCTVMAKVQPNRTISPIFYNLLALQHDPAVSDSHYTSTHVLYAAAAVEAHTGCEKDPSQFTTGSIGSCPFLASWSSHRPRWQRLPVSRSSV